MSLLDIINSPDDLKKLSIDELYTLSNEIRIFLIRSLSKTGGHLASNLGVVELTVALHFCFNSPYDKIIWDVGHQSYIHKILTGRKNKFSSLRQLNGLSGFPKVKESIHDSFQTGHSSTSISVGLGFAHARDLSGGKYKVISVLGDGSMTGGLAFEALNNAGRSGSDLIVILNDNQMSISKNVGAVSRHLNDIRSTPGYWAAKKNIQNLLDKLPIVGEPIARGIEAAKDTLKYVLISGTLFEELGFKYFGPIDGHNYHDLTNVLKNIRHIKGPILLHVYTTKGKGYKFAEKQPMEYHSVSPFNISTGVPFSSKYIETYSDVFGRRIVKEARVNNKIVAVTAAMQDGTGLNLFASEFPDRIFDVGIAESHAVTFAAGLAKSGFIPVFAVYSSFFQRSYDQILHDTALQNVHVIFAIDRAGIVGGDGETHQGIYDISFLSHIPNLVLMSPKNKFEFEDMISFAVNLSCPVAIRYPRGAVSYIFSDFSPKIVLGKMELIEEGSGFAIISLGHMMDTAFKVFNNLKELGFHPTLINARFINPVDVDMLKTLSDSHTVIFTIEDNIRRGGFGSIILDTINYYNISLSLHILSFPNSFIPHGSCAELYEKYNIDYISITKFIEGTISNGC